MGGGGGLKGTINLVLAESRVVHTSAITLFGPNNTMLTIRLGSGSSPVACTGMRGHCLTRLHLTDACRIIRDIAVSTSGRENARVPRYDSHLRRDKENCVRSFIYNLFDEKCTYSYNCCILPSFSHDSWGNNYFLSYSTF